MNRTISKWRAVGWIGVLLILAPVIFPLLIGSGDFFLPAELFPVGMAGGIIILVLAYKRSIYRSAYSLALAGWILFLAGGLVYARISGLAEGTIESEGMPMAILMGGIILSILSQIVSGIIGILVCCSEDSGK